MNNNTEEILEQIDRYLSGEMNVTEKLQFETEIEQNTNVKSLLESTITIKEIFVDYKTIEFKKKTKQIIQKQNNIKLATKIVLPGIVALFVLFASFYLYTDVKPKLSSLGNVKNDSSNSSTIKIAPHNQKHLEYSITQAKTGENITKEYYKKYDTANNSQISDRNTSLFLPQTNINPNATPSKNQDISGKIITIESNTHENILFDCSQTAINFTLVSTPSCKGAASGKITLAATPVGGKYPYSLQITNESNVSLASLENLPMGRYFAKMLDNNGCIAEKEVYIIEKICSETKELILDLNTESSIKIKNAEKTETLTIYSKNGLMIYQKKFLDGESIDWTGTNTAGSNIGNGEYLYSITTNDELIEKGYISLINLQ